MTDISIVVPTYWGWPVGEPGRPEDAIYDHPTPRDQEGTLGRLLESLEKVEHPDFNVLVLTSALNPQLEEAVEAKVEAIIAPFQESYPIAQFASSDLAVLHRRMEELGFDEFIPFISLRGYPNVRNLQLIVPHLMRAEIIVALDDDEVVVADYLVKATEFIGREHQGKPVLGIAGFYLDREGNTLLPEGEPTGNIFLDKSAIMNQGIRALEAAPGRLVETPIALGGNMVIHRRLFEMVSFDPYITRGEDIDYLINASLRGFGFWLDKQLVITHLPPEASNGSPTWSRLHQDVLRFIYEREKLRSAMAAATAVAGTDPSQFDPYPGRFLREDVTTQAIEALRRVADAQMEARLGSAEDIVAGALRAAEEKVARYFAFAREWPATMTTLGKDAALRRYLRGKIAE
ncbi:MAG: hypothetical protein ABIK79_08115 [Chloroflexota bacterium]